MKFFKQNSKYIISISSLVLGAILFVTSLVLYILSYSSYEEDWDLSNGSHLYAKDASLNMNYAIGMIVAIIYISYGAYALYKTIKENKSTLSVLFPTTMLASIIVSVYGFQVFFKKLISCNLKGKEFDYSSYQFYLYFGIGFLLLFAFTTSIVLKEYLKNKSVKLETNEK